MEHQPLPPAAFMGGYLLSLTAHLLRINWSAEFEELVVKIIGAGILGVVGGFAGVLGKWLWDKFKQKFIDKKT